MSKEKLKTKRGITLIALVITIIVMLILVAVTVTVALNGGLFSSAKKATADTETAREAESELSNGQVNIDNTIYNSIEEYVASKPPQPKTVAELFDESKEKLSEIKGKDDSTTDGNLHIGDFINYHAGTWTEEEIKAIKTGKKGAEVEANNDNQNSPKTPYQFGGFAAGGSRDDNAKPFNDRYNYAKFSNGEAITGWRLFDVDTRNNTITLISAGCPEDFYVPQNSGNTDVVGYASEYILSGNENYDARGLDIGAKYTKRNWDNYANENQHATKANPLTKGDLDDWYKKYMEVNDDEDVRNDSIFQRVYKTRCENLIDNYSNYWLASANDRYYVKEVRSYARDMDYGHGGGGGVRVIVRLDSDIQLLKSSRVTVKKMAEDDNHGGPFTYNVWDIK